MAGKTEKSESRNLDGLSVEELEALRDEAAKRIKDVRAKKLEEAFARVDELAKSLGLSRDQLADHYGYGTPTTSGRRRAAVQKYSNPADSNQTWSGRGRKPSWVQAHLDGGGTLAELGIDS